MYKRATPCGVPVLKHFWNFLLEVWLITLRKERYFSSHCTLVFLSMDLLVSKSHGRFENVFIVLCIRYFQVCDFHCLGFLLLLLGSQLSVSLMFLCM